jgi:hypothetical protein
MPRKKVAILTPDEPVKTEVKEVKRVIKSKLLKIEEPAVAMPVDLQRRGVVFMGKIFLEDIISGIIPFDIITSLKFNPIISSRYLPDHEAFMFDAVSPFFDLLKDGQVAPSYRVMVSTTFADDDTEHKNPFYTSSVERNT